MRLAALFVIGFLILFANFGGFVIYNYYSDNGALENEVYSHLESVARSKANRISFFLDERKDDLVFLANSKEVIDLMDTKEITKDINDKLSFFQETNEYLDLILISVEGNVLWNAKQKNLIGVNLNNSEDNKKLGEVYRKVRKDFGVGIFDPGYYDDEEKLSVFVTSPVLVDSETVIEKKDVIGIIALRIDNSQIEERIVSDVGFADSGGEIYLINRDGTPTTLLFDENNMKVTKLDTEMYGDCFTDYNNYYFERQGQEINSVKKSGIYENYIGEEVFGAHQYILETGWCVMVEIEKDKFYDSLKRKRK